MRKLITVMMMLCFFIGTIWAQNDKSVNTVYRMDVIVVATNINPQTSSMLFLANDIHTFDGASVSWNSISFNPFTNNFNQRRGVIIPSGVHTFSGKFSFGGITQQIPQITFDFKPGSFYYIGATSTIWPGTRQFQVTDITNNRNWSPEKEQMEQLMQQLANSSVQPEQATRPVQSGGLQGAVERAAQTVMNNLQQGDSIAIINFTGDFAQFAQEELEVILVNSRFIVVDRVRLDEIRQEQQLQISGDVDDQTAVSIGKFVGAQVVITGSISGTGDMRRLRLRALSTQTARVLAAASEAF